ncbi:hypothetical protein [Haloferax larsenii]|uniref:Uncharacterized protein n=1 Tax=Haloferax larsenii TaxID=302484 RepID=A0A1H7V5W7_HALLR|nr:hypothetical protein [Haloferax larsenii]SEM04225.1 hypothetical protein SAMN04488691_1178 [Haloferax larsenii]
MSDNNNVYDSIEAEQWNEAGLAARSPDDERMFRDSPHAEFDVDLEDAHGADAGFETPEGGQTSVAGDVIGETKDGQPVVASSAGMNSDAANDGKTSVGIGAEFGAWAEVGNTTQTWRLLQNRNSDMTMYDEQGELTIDIPSHMTLADAERSLALEEELLTISARADPVRDGIISEADLIATETERAEENRAVVASLAPRPVNLAFNLFSDDDEMARDFARSFKDHDASEHTEFVEAAPSRQPHRPFGRSAYAEPNSQMVVDEWTDQTQWGPTRLVHEKDANAPLPAHDLAHSQRETIEKLTADVYERVRDKGGLEVPGVDLKAVEKAVTEAVEDTRNELEAVIKAVEDVFHPNSQSLATIEGTWPGCTARVKVVELYEPNAPDSQFQVAKVRDVSPFVEQTSAGSEFAKVTIWHRSSPEETLREGDIVTLANPSPGQYGKQLTLAVTSKTSMYVERRGTGREITWRDAKFTTSYDTHDAVESQKVGGRSGPSAGATIVPVPRYRRLADMMGPKDPNSVDEWGRGFISGRDVGSRVGGCSTVHLVSDSTPEWFAQEASTEMHRFRSADEAVVGVPGTPAKISI